MASKYAVQLDDDVRDVLSRSVITANAVTLPEQLDRKLYERVDKVIKAAGGKWNRSAKAHLFGRDPREALGLALETGEIVNQLKALGQFFTPANLAAYVVMAGRVYPGSRVLEPSAGEGALADAARALGAEVACIEIDPVLVETLRGKGYAVTLGDFLQQTPLPSILQFDNVVMNPPFAPMGADIAHILHAYTFLKPGGYLAAIAGAGVTFRQDKQSRDFRAWVKKLHGHIEPLPDESFKDAGTNVRTVLVTVRKPYGD